MKKIISIYLFLCICLVQTNAQLYVNNNGRTSIGDWTFSQGFLTVRTNTGQSQPQLTFIRADESSCALEVCNFTPTNLLGGSNDITGIRSFAGALDGKTAIGVKASAYPSGSSTSGSVTGLLASAGGSYYGYNFGVCTSLSGQQSGTGIYASSGAYPEGCQIQGQYAGFFNGNVNVWGTLTATTLTQTSDYRLKDNVRQLDNGSLDKLMNVNVVKYRLKNFEINAIDSIERKHYAYDEDSPLLKIDHYGMIAQELQEIYPELVVEGGDGYLSINYSELIPILIKSIQELKGKVDEFEENANRSANRGGETTQIRKTEFPAALYQNNPNPFTENTIVKCLIPQEVSSAVLYIYDMNGHQINSINIAERGEVSITIEGNSLDAGLYMYSLITDGAVIDTKRMILTK